VPEIPSDTKISGTMQQDDATSAPITLPVANNFSRLLLAL